MDLILQLFLTSRLIIGGSGSGKSEGVISELIDLAKSGLCAIVLMDPHGLTARKFMLHLINEGLDWRVLYDRFSDLHRVLSGIAITQSDHPDKRKRKSINQARIIALMSIIWRATQREEDVFSLPMISRYLKWGIKLLMYQPTPEPLSNLIYAYYPNHPICRRLVGSVTDQLTKMEGENLYHLYKSNNFNLLDSKIGGAQRAVEASFEFEVFKCRMDGTFQIGQALLDKKIIILDGSDDGSVPKEICSSLYGCWNYQIFSFAQQYFAQTGNPVPVVTVWEEAPAIGIISTLEINMLREGRKAGCSEWVVGQDIGFLEKTIRMAVLSCTPNHTWNNPGDADQAKIAGEDVALRQLDPMMVHHVDETERVVADGFDYEFRETVTESHGGDHKKSISHTHAPVARHRKVIDKKVTYTGLEDQIKLTISKLLQMGPGWRMITDRNLHYVSKEPEYIPMLPDPFPEEDFPGLAEDKLNLAIAESQARPEFTSPVDCEVPWDSTSTASANKGQRKPSSSLPASRSPQGKPSKGSSGPQPKSQGESSTNSENAEP